MGGARLAVRTALDWCLAGLGFPVATKGVGNGRSGGWGCLAGAIIRHNFLGWGRGLQPRPAQSSKIVHWPTLAWCTGAGRYT